MTYQIEGRWPHWARWRIETASPHSERFPFNAKGELVFKTEQDAEHAASLLRLANEGEFRVVCVK